MTKNIWLILILMAPACKKFVQVSPPVSLVDNTTVYSDNNSASAVMTGVYNYLGSGALSDGSTSMGLLGSLSADELTYFGSDPGIKAVYSNSLTSQTPNTSTPWQQIYKEIFVANAVLEAMPQSTGVTSTMKQQLTGEAKFIRAFLHFYATNLYGNVPLVTSTNYVSNDSMHRSPQADVYNQMIHDLKDAEVILNDNYLDAAGSITNYKIRPNKGAVQALLARVYLYAGKSDSAELYATKVINSKAAYTIEKDFSKTFLGNSTEAIWQLYPVSPNGYNTQDGRYYILKSTPGTGPYTVAMATSLLNAFDSGDLRFQNWVGQFTKNGITYYYPYKYKIGTAVIGSTPAEYIMVLRLAEQYLIRAEARAQLGNTAGARSDINVIRNRAGLPDITTNDQPSLLSEILHERQVELFTEWGHRWFDLKRTNHLDAILGSPGNICIQKGGAWAPFRALLPIPYQEILYNTNLTQNTGY